MNLADLSVKEFLNQTSQDVPVPGGGSVAALSAALGASLILMVGNMTKRKADKAGVQLDADLQTAIKISNHAKIEFEKLIDKDAVAFDGVMAAFKLPKETEEDKVARRSAIQAGYKNAIQPPLVVAKHACGLIESAGTMATKGDPNALSDAAVAVKMLNAAVWGGTYNVRINLSAIQDTEFVEATTKEVCHLEEKADQLTQEILSKIAL